MSSPSKAFRRELAHRVSNYRLAAFRYKRTAKSDLPRESIVHAELDAGELLLDSSHLLEDSATGATLDGNNSTYPSLTCHEHEPDHEGSTGSITPKVEVSDRPALADHGVRTLQNSGDCIAPPLLKTTYDGAVQEIEQVTLQNDIATLQTQLREATCATAKVEASNVVLRKRIAWFKKVTERHEFELKSTVAVFRATIEATENDRRLEHTEHEQLKIDNRRLLEELTSARRKNGQDIEHLKGIITSFRRQSLELQSPKDKLRTDRISHLLCPAPRRDSTSIRIICLERDLTVAQVIVKWLQTEEFEVYSQLRLRRELIWTVDSFPAISVEDTAESITCFLGVSYAGWDHSQQSAMSQLKETNRDLLRIWVHPADTQSLVDLALPSLSDTDVALTVSARSYSISSAQNEIGIEQLLAAIMHVTKI